MGVEKSGKCLEKAIYVGAVGARFEKENVMEWQDIVITKTQNIEALGYGSEENSKNRMTYASLSGNIRHMLHYSVSFDPINVLSFDIMSKSNFNYVLLILIFMCRFKYWLKSDL